MFTGLIEAVGHVSLMEPTVSGLSMRIRTALAPELKPGDSVAVNGVCLTVTGTDRGEMLADVGPETARVTTLASLQRDRPVNLERSMRADGRFGGHLVQGHVDGTGRIEELREEGDAYWLTVSHPVSMAPYIVLKGSLAVDGISLTVAALDDARLDVMIVPFTWQHTNLPSLAVGDSVNLECDMIGKYVARSMALFRT